MLILIIFIIKGCGIGEMMMDIAKDEALAYMEMKLHQIYVLVENQIQVLQE